MRFNGYRKNYWKMALLLVGFVFLFLSGCSQSDKGDTPKKVDAPAPQKVETPAPAPAKAAEPAKTPEPAKTQEPVKAPAAAKAPGDAKNPPAKPAAKAGAAPAHNTDYDP